MCVHTCVLLCDDAGEEGEDLGDVWTCLSLSISAYLCTCRRVNGWRISVDRGLGVSEFLSF